MSRLAAVRDRIRRAAERAGRDPTGVALVAVSKTVPPERVLELAAAGQLRFGENKVQEARVKIPAVRAGWSGPPLVWHWIGHLQRNKVRPAVDLFHRFDSVDSLRLAEALGAEAVRRDRTLDVLVQYNCSGEPTKGGFRPEEVDTVADRLRDVPGLRVVGVMTIARPAEDPEAARPDFRLLADLRRRLEDAWGRELPVLSMGMSHDLEPAVEEGSTEVRVGTALFGPRQRPQKETA